MARTWQNQLCLGGVNGKQAQMAHFMHEMSHSGIVDFGCLPFTTTFRKFRLESKWYTTFRVVPVENFREQRNVWKGSPVFPDGMFRTEIRVPFVQT